MQLKPVLIKDKCGLNTCIGQQCSIHVEIGFDFTGNKCPGMMLLALQ